MFFFSADAKGPKGDQGERGPAVSNGPLSEIPQFQVILLENGIPVPGFTKPLPGLDLAGEDRVS